MTNKKKSCSWTYRIFILLTLISTAGVAAIALEFVSKKMLPFFVYLSFYGLYTIFVLPLPFYLDLNTITINHE